MQLLVNVLPSLGHAVSTIGIIESGNRGWPRYCSNAQLLHAASRMSSSIVFWRNAPQAGDSERTLITIEPYVLIKTTKEPPVKPNPLRGVNREFQVTIGKRSASRNLSCIVAIRGADYGIACNGASRILREENVVLDSQRNVRTLVFKWALTPSGIDLDERYRGVVVPYTIRHRGIRRTGLW
ncbi:hypothetical protein ARMSODRAFT_975564 [Armillaria solidipes]|uniref:Uncharacterized protein n=1 Tax=Armillaria solidipes TaxID=1076256 RepID=A0A2H3BCS3_9AGAR|nr:hypothetical protein ARMSODRAFT_975564 [Armillaria solidipes]